MKHSQCSLLFAMVTAAGCVEMEPDAELDSIEASIVDGTGQVPLAHGVALVSKTCSATMVSNDIALTTASCAPVGSTLVVGASNAKVRNVRVPRRSNGNDAAIVAVQLYKPLLLSGSGGASTSGFVRDIDRTPVKQGESVNCFGYSNDRLSSATFDVIDGSTDTLYKLRRRNWGAPGVSPTVSAQDLGGFCQRDGGAIAAILTAKTDPNGIALAIPVHDLVGGLIDVEVARVASQSGVAIRLRDDRQQRFLTAMPGSNRVMAQAAASTDLNQRDQAFYLEPISNPQAQGTYHRMVDARSGRCLTVVSSSFLVQQSCDTTLLAQRFFIQATQVNGFDRYIVGGTGGNADADGTPSVTMRPSVNNVVLGSQQFEMWLTLM